jgi:MFS family permease
MRKRFLLLISPLRFRSFRALWVSQVASEVGDWAGRVALAVLVFQRTDSAVLTGAVTTVSLAPYVGIGQAATAFVSRFPRRRVLVACDVARAGAFFAMAFDPPIAALFALAAVAGLMTPPFEAVRSAMLPNTVDDESYGNAVALANVTAEAALLGGYLIGGALVGAIGAHTALALNGGSFLISAAFLLGLPRPRRTAADPVRTRTADGFRAAFGDPFVRRFLVGYALIGACAITGEALAPVFVSEELHRGQGTVGALSAIVSAGVIIVALFLPRDGDERRLVVFSGLLAAGGAVVAALAFAFLGGLGGAAVAYVALGALFASRIPGNQVVGTRIPDGVRAAAFSVLAGVIAVGQATGPLLAGALTELLGVRPTLVLFAIAAFVVGASMALLPMREEAVSSPATR